MHGAGSIGWHDPTPASIFPQPIGTAAAFDTSLMRRVGQVTSTEMRALGAYERQKTKCVR